MQLSENNEISQMKRKMKETKLDLETIKQENELLSDIIYFNFLFRRILGFYSYFKFIFEVGRLEISEINLSEASI
jgi:hypothetical protein